MVQKLTLYMSGGNIGDKIGETPSKEDLAAESYLIELVEQYPDRWELERVVGPGYMVDSSMPCVDRNGIMYKGLTNIKFYIR